MRRMIGPIAETVFEMLPVENIRLMRIPHVEQKQIGIVAVVYDFSIAPESHRDFARKRPLDLGEQLKSVRS